jgi:hypothetical protein
MSTMETSKPLRAATKATPWPITPAPTTKIFFNIHDLSSYSPVKSAFFSQRMKPSFLGILA